jgi:hypothetical protein
MRYSKPDEDKFYEVRGVRPPERVPHLTDEELEARFEANRAKRHCQWHQQGPEVYCTTCTLQHGTFVGTNQLLVGTDARGCPILKAVVVSQV